MDRLWAPWRIGYVSKADKEGVCFLCAAAADNDDHNNLIVRRSTRSFAILNRFPYNNAHVLVAPRSHKSELSDLSDEERTDLIDLLLDVQAALRATFNPHGFNIGFNIGAAAGAGVPGHLHAHIVPRWTGDTNFVTVFADVKIISQSLEESYAAITGYFERMKTEKRKAKKCCSPGVNGIE